MPRLVHRMLFVPAFALALGLGTACGGAPPPAAPAADVAAPYPFTVYDIRAGCPMGRVIEYRIEKAGSPPHTERWSFVPADDDSVKITTATFDDTGKPTGDPTTETHTWTELHEHAHFPASATKIYNESISLPAGTFDAMRYVVSSGGKDDEVKTVWFARSLPGPPVKLEVVKGGQTVMTWTMQANRTH